MGRKRQGQAILAYWGMASVEGTIARRFTMVVGALKRIGDDTVGLFGQH